ncbi:MAG: NAD(P)/FAD-dependent oxidoreductase, partial [Sphingomonadales bacterium]|nr:NAD(P)/FAD-dependent oxidoreductase [Sphingomonadales bacterium]
MHVVHIVVLGAGLGGVPMACEMKDLMKKGEKLTVISNTDYFHFVPSNPWVAVNWRTRDDIEVFLPDVFKKKGVEFTSSGAKKVDPENNRVELNDGQFVEYDYLIIATGPELAFDEIEGLGPDGYTQSVCHVDHALTAGEEWEKFCADPGPIVVGAVQGASC